MYFKKMHMSDKLGYFFLHRKDHVPVIHGPHQLPLKLLVTCLALLCPALLSIRTAQVTVPDTQLHTSEGEHSKHSLVKRRLSSLPAQQPPSTHANTDLKKQCYCQRTPSRQRCQQTSGNHPTQKEAHCGHGLSLGSPPARSWEPRCGTSNDALEQRNCSVGCKMLHLSGVVWQPPA